MGIYQTLLGALKLYFCHTKILFGRSNIMSLMNACLCSSYSALVGSCFVNIHQDSKWFKYNAQMPWGIRGTLSPGTDRDRQPTGGLLWKSRRPRDKSETGVTGQWAPQRPLGSPKFTGRFVASGGRGGERVQGRKRARGKRARVEGPVWRARLVCPFGVPFCVPFCGGLFRSNSHAGNGGSLKGAQKGAAEGRT